MCISFSMFARVSRRVLCVCVWSVYHIYAALKRKTEKEYIGTRTEKAVHLNEPPSRGPPVTRDLFVRLQLFKICTILIKHHSFFTLFIF